MSLVSAVTLAALALWVIRLVRRRRGGSASLGVAITVTVVALVAWGWAISFDAAFPDRSLRAPVIIVSAILALGAINALTGTRMHSRASGGRMGLFLGRD